MDDLTIPRFHSGVVAGAREALINGVPSMSISLNWCAVGPCCTLRTLTGQVYIYNKLGI